MESTLTRSPESTPPENTVPPAYWAPAQMPPGPGPQPVKASTSPPGFGFLASIFKALGHYPKAMIELVLTILSITLGLLLLPPLSVVAPPSQTAIKAIGVYRSANVPTYVLDRPADQSTQGGPQNVVTIGMDIPKTSKPVGWTLFIFYAKGDHLSHIEPQKGGTDGPGHSPDEWQFSGTVNPGSNSYSEFRQGFLENFLIDPKTPSDIARISFDVSGPVSSQVISGPRLAVVEPMILMENSLYTSVSATNQQAAPAPFNAEVLYDAGSYELQGSGPTVTGPPANMSWDWFGQNGLQSTSAVGVNTAGEQNDQNHLFLAAVFFGLSAAAGAAFALELVNAIQEHGRERRRSKPKGHLADNFQA